MTSAQLGVGMQQSTKQNENGERFELKIKSKKAREGKKVENKSHCEHERSIEGYSSPMRSGKEEGNL